MFVVIRKNSYIGSYAKYFLQTQIWYKFLITSTSFFFFFEQQLINIHRSGDSSIRTYFWTTTNIYCSSVSSIFTPFASTAPFLLVLFWMPYLSSRTFRVISSADVLPATLVHSAKQISMIAKERCAITTQLVWTWCLCFILNLSDQQRVMLNQVSEGAAPAFYFVNATSSS